MAAFVGYVTFLFVILLSYFGIMARQGNKHNLAVEVQEY